MACGGSGCSDVGGGHVSIWFGAVLRGDIARVEVGEGSNIQDNSVLHVGDHDPCLVLGSPAKVIRPLTDEERKDQAVFAPKYVLVAEEYRRLLTPSARSSSLPAQNTAG
jgi:carbonic anhydrase/acetyltransferase-like protein (isoleucine patch superfamily)